MHERRKINQAMLNGLVVGGRRHRHRRGRFGVTLEKGVKRSFLASGSLFFGHFLTNLSAPLLSDGFTGKARGGRGQEKLAEKLPLI